MDALNPLVYFWVAIYRDGTCLPQFDFENGKENAFKDIDQTKLEKFGLFPFNDDLASKANTYAKMTIATQRSLPYFVLKLEEGQRLINIRRNFLHMFSFYSCDKCGYVWQAMKGYSAGTIGDAGLPIHGDTIIEEESKRETVKCPKCGAYNATQCPDCKSRLEVQKPPEGYVGIYRICPKCKRDFPWFIKMGEDSKHLTSYIVGYQTTVDGKNAKQLMFIKEDGTINLKNEL